MPQLVVRQHRNFTIVQHFAEKRVVVTILIQQNFAAFDIVTTNTHDSDVIEPILMHPFRSDLCFIEHGGDANLMNLDFLTIWQAVGFYE